MNQSNQSSQSTGPPTGPPTGPQASKRQRVIDDELTRRPLAEDEKGEEGEEGEEDERCASCGTPWSVSDQEEWLREDFYSKFRRGDAATVQRVREYWKEHVIDWIDDVEDDERNDECHDAVPKSLREVVEIMMRDFAFYCEDCNNGADGSRCYRNRARASR
jgi:hypothetical protein